MNLGRANLDVFGDELVELGHRHPELTVVTSDSRGSGKIVRFGEMLPSQMVEVGIAEQNLVGIAAGLAAGGRTVYAVSPASFLTARALEQIKNDVAYSDRPVTLVGISAGVSYGALGSTHHSLHDFAALRAIHNIDIVAPADNFETRAAIRAALGHPRPLYIRFGKRPIPDVHDPDTPFKIGKAIVVREGRDVTFVATGEMVPPALAAADLLAADGIQAGVISMHTVKPLDKETLLAAARGTGALITVEEHSVHGGLGGACAEALMQAGVFLPFQNAAIPDEDTATGSQSDIFKHYGLTDQGLAERARILLREARVAQ